MPVYLIPSLGTRSYSYVYVGSRTLTDLKIDLKIVAQALSSSQPDARMGGSRAVLF